MRCVDHHHRPEQDPVLHDLDVDLVAFFEPCGLTDLRGDRHPPLARTVAGPLLAVVFSRFSIGYLGRLPVVGLCRKTNVTTMAAMRKTAKGIIHGRHRRPPVPGTLARALRFIRHSGRVASVNDLERCAAVHRGPWRKFEGEPRDKRADERGHGQACQRIDPHLARPGRGSISLDCPLTSFGSTQ